VVAGTEQPERVPRFTETDTPTAIDGVEIAVFEGEAVLFDESSSMLHRLGAIAGAVWLCCDGATDVATIVRDLCEMFDHAPDEMSPVVHQTLERFADEGLLVGHVPAGRASTGSTSGPTAADDGTQILTPPPDP
jgi:hypothetical protein